jgi:hypothetical protein
LEKAGRKFRAFGRTLLLSNHFLEDLGDARLGSVTTVTCFDPSALAKRRPRWERKEPKRLSASAALVN